MTKDIDELKKKLTDHQFYVTKQNGTERPFANEYLDNEKKGIYVDVISGEPLFSSEIGIHSRHRLAKFFKAN